MDHKLALLWKTRKKLNNNNNNNNNNDESEIILSENNRIFWTICRQINRLEYSQKELPTRIETQNTEIQNTTETCLKFMLTQEERENVDLILKIMIEKKTILPSLRYKDWKKPRQKPKRVNKLLKNIPTAVTELNELAYAWEKLVSDKIAISPKNPNRNAKPGWEIRLKW